MNATDLIERILDAAGIGIAPGDFLDADDLQTLDSFQVQVATQPSYPLNLDVAGVISNEEVQEDEDAPAIIWISAPNNNYERPYAPRAVFHS